MLDLFSKAMELSADRTGELAMLCGKLQGLWCFQLSFGELPYNSLGCCENISHSTKPIEVLASLAFSCFFLNM